MRMLHKDLGQLD